MKKFVIGLITTIMLAIPNMNLVARHHGGDAAAGVAAGLIGGAMITGIASSSNSRAKRAEDEARRAQEQTEQLREQQQREKMYDIERKMEKQQIIHRTSSMTNILIIAIIFLFLGLLGLGVVILKRK